jgi:hypothetical protein
MSYDLYFRVKPGMEVPSIDAMQNYFSKERHYKIKGNTALYENEDTGVYFLFEFITDKAENIPSDLGSSVTLPITFNINYYRPHIFGLEADLALSAFISQFNLSVSDDQIEGMGNGEYSSQGFLNAWNKGNEIAYPNLIKNEKTSPFSLPSNLIETYWKWNYNVEEFQRSLGEDIYVPRIMFFPLEGKVEPVVVWTDGIPNTIPELDTYLIYRSKPTGLFSKKPSFALVKKQQLMPLLSRYQVKENHMPYYNLAYRSIPKDIETFVKSLPAYKVELQKVPIHRILDRELVDKYTAR